MNAMPSPVTLRTSADVVGAYHSALASGTTDAQTWAWLAGDLADAARHTCVDERRAQLQAMSRDAFTRADAALTGRTIPPGDTIVVLADGSVGRIESLDRDEVHVVFDDRTVGRGPWVLSLTSVQPATREQAEDYLARCTGAL